MKFSARSLLPTGLILTALLSLTSCNESGSIELTILHTNDVHSQHIPQSGNDGIGGLIRMKTKANEIRAKAQYSTLVDAGDFSEGSPFFNIDGGASVLQTMDQMGYDVVLVGNHDYINGPDTLLDAYRAAKPKFQMIVANIKTDHYERAQEFNENIFPYVIKDYDGVKVAYIGLTTFEVIFDKFFLPIKVTDPVSTLTELTAKLKPEVDAIVVVSHNSLVTNKLLLQSNPLIDIMVSGHTHQLLEEPIAYPRSGGNPSWLVQSGYWASHLGEVKFQIERKRTIQPGAQVKPLFYKAHPLDASVADDPAMFARIEEMKSKLRAKYGNDFFEAFARSSFTLGKSGVENTMGNLLTDSYRSATHADVALDQMGFVYGKLREGPLTPYDIINANPGVYHPIRDKVWTLRTLVLPGSILSTVATALVAKDGFLAQLGSLAVSGAEILYGKSADTKGMVVQAIRIGDQPIDLNKDYKLVVSGGGLEAFETLNRVKPGLIPFDKIIDTGIETWQALKAEIISRGSNLTKENTRVNHRIKANGIDLALMEYDIELGADRVIALRVENAGTFSTEGLVRRLQIRLNGDPLGAAALIPTLKAGQSFLATAVVPTAYRDEKKFRIEGEIQANDELDLDPSNDRAEREFSSQK